MNYNTLLKRHRGDTFPVEATLTRNSAWTATGSNIKLTFKFEDGDEYSFTGTVVSDTDPLNKDVLFEPTEVAVASVRNGIYDIQVDDGSYIATHLKGTLKIINDVTP